MTWEGVWSSTAKKHHPHQSFHISPTHTCYLIYRGLARQLEGDMGQKGIQANMVYIILIYPGCFSAYHWSVTAVGPASCYIFVTFLFFFPREIKFTNFELHPPWCWASHLQPHVRSWSFWGFNSCAAGLGGCLEQVRPPCAAVRRNVVVKVKLFMVGLQ